MKILTKPNKFLMSAAILFFGLSLQAQTNVFDDVISISPDHTSLTAALEAAELDDDLQNPNANFTVLAPDNDAFEDLADQLGVTVADLLELDNLGQILLYHVIDTELPSSAIANGDIQAPLSNANTIKFTVTSGGDVFANQAQVNAPDLTADNGVVHSLDAVILSDETVVDVAIDNGFTSLTAAVIAAELLPALTDPFAEYTVFAPSDAAFSDLAAALGTDLDGILENPELANILLYHVLGEEVMSAMIANGDIVTPLNAVNTINLTVTSGGDVFANQAQVELADVGADNGVVHAIDAVITSNETVVDIAIDNGFTSLTAAVVTAELLPALTDPFAEYTVFAPSDDAFADLAAALGTDLDGVLANPELASILTYHVLGEEVMSAMIANGDIVTPLNATNTIKLTATSEGDVFANQAQVELADAGADNGVVHAIDAVITSNETVVDIAIDNGFTSLTAAVVAAELLPALTDPFAEYTVFAPSDDAFADLAAALGTDLDGILENPELANILLYHVLGEEVMSSMINNGDIVTPLNNANTIKLTATESGAVFANQAQVELADVGADNGVVHAIDAVILSSETVVDVAIDNGFTSLTTAVVTAELLPALTDPFAELTVFAPSDAAFNDLAAALGTDLDGVLANPELAGILTYHVLGEEVMSSMINNGDIVTPLNNANTIKLTVTEGGDVFANQAQVELADVGADNGVVHAIDAVILSSETVADVAIDNGFTALTAAVVTAELLPALSDPFAEYTVFAPTDQAFNNLASDLGTDLDGVLATPFLDQILLFHVVGEELFAADLENGSLEMLSGQSTTIDLSDGVQIDNASVVGPDNTADNGVVHAINAVLDGVLSVDELEKVNIDIFPNPTVDFLRVQGFERGNYAVFDTKGTLVKQGLINGTREINLSDLDNGVYILNVQNEESFSNKRFVKL